VPVVLDDFSAGTLENLAAIRENGRLLIIGGDILDRHVVAVNGVDTVFHEAREGPQVPIVA
jgi:hypothetical protein